jgi:hypothetical protein
MLETSLREKLLAISDGLVTAGRPDLASDMAKVIAEQDRIPSPPASSPFTPGDNGLPPNMMATVMPWHLLIPEGFELVIRRSPAGA